MKAFRPNQRWPRRRALAALAFVALIWALVVALRGGFYLHLGPIVISSRRSTPALLLFVLSLGGMVGLTLARGREAAQAEWTQAWARTTQTARQAAALVQRHAMLVPLVIVLVVCVQATGRWATPRSLWLDEESTLLNVRDRGFTELPGTLWLGQSAPLGWMAAERGMMLLAGTGDRALRFLPMLCGVGLCVLAYLIGRRWLNVVGTTVFVWCCAFGQWVAHNRFEAKPYSADGFTALLVMALAAWAVDAPTADRRQARATVWWLVAAAALWVANGAFLTAPGCALIVVGVVWRRDGWRPALRAAAWGGAWFVSFALCYWFSLRYTQGSTYLYEYWTSISAFPQADATLLERFGWLGGRFKELAENPGGTALWLTFWLAALGGVLVSPRGLFALLAAAPPVTAFVLGMTHLVPLHDRVAFWMLPGLYLAIALLADRAGDWLGGARGRLWRPVAAVALLVPVGFLCQNLFRLRNHDVSPMGVRSLNHGLDDERAVAYLLAHRRPGDAVLTTHLNWASIWWYGGISLADGSPAVDGHFADGGVQFEAGYDDTGLACRHEGSIAYWLRTVPRLLVYAGFPDQQETFGPDIEAQLKRVGTVRDIEQFGEGLILIVDPQPPAVRTEAPAEERCIGVGLATRW